MGRQRGRQRFQKKHDQGWVPFLQLAGNVTAGTPSMNTLVDQSDWASGTMAEMCTIMSIRGQLSMTSDFGASISTALTWAIMLVDVSLVASDADLALIDTWERDILYTGLVHVSHSATEQNWDPGKTWDIHVKARRRMQSKQKLVLMLESPITNAGFGCIIRTLVRRD